MASQSKPNAFATINAISSTRPLTYADLEEQGLPYEPFLINRAFSLCSDSVLAASLMNQHPQLSKAAQATFYIHTLRPRRRFEKWPKALDDDRATTIAKYYGMSMREAKLHVDLHTSEQYTAMAAVLKTGATPSRM